MVNNEHDAPWYFLGTPRWIVSLRVRSAFLILIAIIAALLGGASIGYYSTDLSYAATLIWRVPTCLVMIIIAIYVRTLYDRMWNSPANTEFKLRSQLIEDARRALKFLGFGG